MKTGGSETEPTVDELIQHLSTFVTPERLARMEQVLENRTRYITVCVEDIYQPHNGSAVLRTCDACGIQDVHIIENRNRYQTNPGVELGSAQWLSLHYHSEHEHNTLAAYERLRSRGYRMVALTPHHDPIDLEELSLHAGPLALVFGNELDGLTREAIDHADERVRIPMVGFVESFNISVSAAICLHRLAFALREHDLPWPLRDDEKQELLLSWLRRSVKHSEMVEERFRASR
jgi:tRNA (guanosine-2'-O-)-methyltransferase